MHHIFHIQAHKWAIFQTCLGIIRSLKMSNISSKGFNLNIIFQAHKDKIANIFHNFH